MSDIEEINIIFNMIEKLLDQMQESVHNKAELIFFSKMLKKYDNKYLSLFNDHSHDFHKLKLMNERRKRYLPIVCSESCGNTDCEELFYYVANPETIHCVPSIDCKENTIFLLSESI